MTNPIADPATWWLGHISPAVIKTNLTDPANAALYDTGWQALTSNLAGWTCNTLAVRRIGQWVELRGQITRNTTAAVANGNWQTGVITMPSGFSLAPSTSAGSVVFRGTCGTQGSTFDWRVNTDRTLDLRNVGTVDLPATGVVNASNTWSIG